MKPGIEVGRTETIQVEVTDDMFASFEGHVVHPVYSTVAMVYHMEWVSRKIILPFLEEHEEGMGAAVEIKHIDAAPRHSNVILTATLTEYRDQQVITTVEARNEYGLIGKGKVKQVILPKEVIRNKTVSTSE
ncbi:thioesterase family protein [Tenuibacillus multivorans]|uniref:Predicted thioesterase n=1 Tax=Tenuibacillus multivorans TaxID=237069 RepID=A0A1H0BVR5_9BACI|nr:thioesterase [Tenuibacillus multivorans]GEL77014.1 thioesterase [Tenuibacillus multivorans]SDN49751.1 Predicted thioesterase [Tenuibacillus multivorans]